MTKTTTFKLNPELKNAWDKVLFWSKRLSYASADKHPNWRVEYEKAKKNLEEVKARLEAEKANRIAL